MASEVIVVEAECLESTAVDIQYFTKGRTYSIDMEWAKARDIWRYFRPLREIPQREAEERVEEERVTRRARSTG